MKQARNTKLRHRTISTILVTVGIAAIVIAVLVVAKGGNHTPQEDHRWSIPTGRVSWQWVLNHPLDLKSPSDMGTNDLLPDGGPAPTPTVYDVDGIINPASTVKALHERHDHVICYVEVGSAGNYYSAEQEGIATSYFDQFVAAGVLGRTLPGYSQESFLNINSPATVRNCRIDGPSAVRCERV